ILVNVPSFTLRAYSFGKLVMESPVIVGKPGRQTPIFETNVVGVKFHPTWSPPPSILKKDILPTLGTEKSFAASHGLHISYDGSPIDEIDITEEMRYSGKLRFIQSPGDDNALGVLKFETDNDQNIYLHDTNSRKLFVKSQRALSSGCVRVQEWKKLAAWVQDIEESGIDKKLEKSGTRIEKTEKVPVSIVYSLADKKSDKWMYFPNIYGRNIN
ncbi:MAG TPA: L,D-transpeptidase family protein, partial [Ignavibacteriaceae bacterium]